MENKVKMISELLFHYFSHNGNGLSGIPNRMNVKSISTWGLKWTRSVDRLWGSVPLSSCAQTEPCAHTNRHTRFFWTRADRENFESHARLTFSLFLSLPGVDLSATLPRIHCLSAHALSRAIRLCHSSLLPWIPSVPLAQDEEREGAGWRVGRRWGP